MQRSAASSSQSAPADSVLLVDDSSVQRRHGVELCRELGVATIYEAGNGREALALLDSLPHPPCLLIVDLEMPTMDGPELLAQLRERGIDIPIVVASSRERALIQSVCQMGNVLGLRILAKAQKPLTREALAEVLQNWQKLPASPKPSPHAMEVDVEALRIALERNEICVHYQPKIEISSGAVRGVEALARWQHPQLGLIFPDAFIPLSERHDLINQLTLQVIHQSLLQAVEWNAQGVDISVAINLSPMMLDRPGLVQEIVGLQRTYGIAAERIIFEVTESSLLRELAVALRVLNQLRLRGFGLALDDYGTGFSSMQQLAQIPFTELKIDRSFIHTVFEREDMQIMLRSALEMSRELGLITVAEGVESSRELELLRGLGCTFVQGWLFAKAMPGHDLVPWLRRHEARATLPA
jgi:EAL domain-containing protein (putative c-di-GMP-specific phosphodiesterase class I)